MISEKETKALNIDATKDKKNDTIKIESKETYCYPQYGKSVKASSREDADKQIKKNN